MNQTPKIITLEKKLLVGHALEMSLTDNKTFELFSGFMPLKKEIENSIGSDIFEIMIYEDSHFKNFNPTNRFVKWAAVEVETHDTIPQNMKPFTLDSGLYAVFNYKGLPKDFGNLMHYIFSTWMPNSNYVLETRPHFNVLGTSYKRNDPNSEETVWIPIQLK